MIKAIGTNPIRKTTMALMIAAPLMLGACKNGNKNNSVQQNQTEVVSKAGSDSLRIQSFINDYTDAHLINTRHNLRLEEKFREMYGNDEKMIDIANENGLFGATTLLQMYVDGSAFKKALNNYINDFDDNAALKSIKQELNDKSYDEYFIPIIKSLIYDNLIYSDKYSKFVDDCLKNCALVTKDDIKDYENSVNCFITKQDSLGTAQQMANLISYKMFKADSIIFQRYLEKYPEFKKQTENGEFKTFDEYFQKYFTEAARPEP